ncbi:AT-rich interactive domain-containing protein 4B [Athalia rosae]|uniref:AT-rich interactive domain-containing protein 4B n=1 Tax=Athalia rosae TaxID=37344 RepID=UPI0020332586|nr:AT-rich interactive domain-containing protein 4B [Athalia rosae]
MLGDDPPYLSVGTEVSAKYKGAFCEAKIRKVVRSVKCRVTYKQGLGTATVTDDQIKGTLRVGASVEAKHNDRKEFVEATVTKIQDCSQYTVVFDDGDITTLRRTALCLKSGRHFAESETLDQLPLTHPEHFGNPVIGGRRGRRSRQAQDESSDDEDSPPRGARESGSGGLGKECAETEPEIGRVVCVELGDKKKKDNWFPGLVVAPTAQDTVRIRVRDDYLVRSFKDARYYTVPKKEATEFTKELVNKVENNALRVAVEKALLFLDKNELPPHWDRDSLFGNADSSGNSDSDGELDSDSSDDEPREEKDHFVAQLYKFMDDRGTPINNCPMIGTQDIDLYRLFRAVYKLGGYNRVTNQNQWKSITRRLGFPIQSTSSTHGLVKQQYKKFLHSFEDFYRKLGCTMVNHPRGGTRKQRPGRSLIRDRDRSTPVPPQMPSFKFEKEEDEKRIEIEEKRDKKDVKKEIIKEEEVLKITKKEDFDKSGDGHESDVIVDGEEESSSSEKSLKASIVTPPVVVATTSIVATTSTPIKVKSSKVIKEEKRKPLSDKKKGDTKKLGEKKEEKVKQQEEEQPTVTRSKSKDDTTSKGKAVTSETRDVRTPSAETENKKILPKQRRPTDEELKKRGRKRKESEPEKSKAAEEMPVDPAPSYKGVVELGDRLKVYYGPTHESKVTYEAKVIDIEKVSAEPVYLVHYTGWNTRYDEWIKGSRIAQNFTQTQVRVKRGKTTPRPQTPSAAGSSTSNKLTKMSAQSRRRAHSVAPTFNSSSGTVVEDGKRDEKDKDNQQPPRSTTPSSIASSSSRTKSPATPAVNRKIRVTRNQQGLESRRRTRRMSGHTDISVASESDSEAYESDTMEPEQARTRSRGIEERKRSSRRRGDDEVKAEDCSEVEEDKDGTHEELRRGRRLRRTPGKSQAIKSEPESDDDQPKGRDFDLNQIRSELKGFEKAVKLELIRVERDSDDQKEDDGESGAVVQPTLMPGSPKTDKKLTDLAKLEPVIDPKPPESTDDIYEFKEPEPFEFEVRNKRDPGVEKDKVKKRVFDEEPKSPKKKQKTLLPSTKEIKIEGDNDQKKRVRRPFNKRADDTEVTPPPGKVKSQSACEEAFDKLCESPSFSPLKPSTVSEEVGKVALDMLFSDLPGDEDGTADDPEDRLIISETEVSEAEQENLFTYQQEIFPSSDIPDTMEFSKEEVKANQQETVEEKPVPVSVQSSPIVQDAKQTTSKISTSTPVIADTKILDIKPLESSPALSPALVTPAPISTRLPATSTIEEKLSAAALAFRNKFKDIRKEDQTGDEGTWKSTKESSKKSFSETSATAKKTTDNEGEKKKPDDDEDEKKKEEERRETMRAVIKQKEEELQQLKMKKVTELKKAVEAKAAAAVVEQKKIVQQEKEDEQKDRAEEEELSLLRKDEERREREQTERDKDKEKEKEKDKRKRIISQEFLDSTDSSDSEQRLVIDNEEPPEEKYVSSNFDIKLRAELEKLQDIQENRATTHPHPSPTPAEKSTLAVVTPILKTEEEAENISSLLCEEEIPGSPAPVVDNIDQATVSTTQLLPSQVEAPGSSIVLLEMPFASAPTSGQSSGASATSTISTVNVSVPKSSPDVSVPVSLPVQQASVLGPRSQPTLQAVLPQPQPNLAAAPAAAQRRESNEAAPVMDNTPPTTPDSTISNISGSPRDEGTGGSSPLFEDNTKSNRDSSEADNDSASKGLGGGFSEDDVSLPIADSAGGQDRNGKTIASKRTAEASPSPKKRKRSRKHSECSSNVGKKSSTARHVGRHSRHSGAATDSDDTSESSNICPGNANITSHTNIPTVPDLPSYSTRSPRPLKYNFYVELDPELDGSQRIAVLQQKLTELRKTYNAVKVELAGIERRRKKLRRRERDALKAAKAEMQQACS